MSSPPGSLLGAARARRRLSVDQAADRASMDPDAVRALEEGRLHRFPSLQDAVAAATVYAASLGISERETKRLAGLPVRPRLLQTWSIRRLGAAAAFGASAGLLAWFVLVPRLDNEGAPPLPTAAPAPIVPTPALPERWEIRVDVLNGSKAAGAATRLANKVAGLAYRVGEVSNAPRRDYRISRVYFPPGADAIAERLGGELGIGTAALPGGKNPLRLYVIIGTKKPPT